LLDDGVDELEPDDDELELLDDGVDDDYVIEVVNKIDG